MPRIIFLLLFSLIINSCSGEKEKTIVGQWEPVSRPYNLGTTLIFGADSSYRQIKEARIDYTYQFQGDTLISTSFNRFSNKTIIDSAQVAIKGDTLTLVRGKIGDQQETVMIRYDSIYQKKDGIIGFWKWSHQSGREAISEFHPDGRAVVSVMIEQRSGFYYLSGDSLTVVMPGTTLRDIYYQLKNDSLFFPNKYAPFGKAFYRVSKDD